MQRLDLKTEIEQELLNNPCLEEESPENETPEAGETGETAAGEGDGLLRDSAATDSAVDSADGGRDDIDFEYYFGDDSRGPGDYAPSPGGDDDEYPTLEQTATRADSLHEHLGWQLGANESDPECRAIGEFLIGNLQENGFLAAPPEELAAAGGFALEELEIVRARLREYDPPGCFARDLSDCLGAQLAASGEEDSLAARLLGEAGEALAAGAKDEALAAQLGVEAAEIAAARRRLAQLDPEPGLRFSAERGDPPEPDLVLTLGEPGEFTLSFVEDGLPKLRVSSYYRRAIRRGSSAAPEEKAYVRERLRAAVWFIKSLEERRKTIMKVAHAAITRQLDYFTRGEDGLKPLLLREVAAVAGVHESTVSRVAANKFVLTPKGLLPLKFFFVKRAASDGGDDLSARQVKQQIQEIIAREIDARKPLSDEKIAGRLRADYNVILARRTVQKYREELGIPAAHARAAAARQPDGAEKNGPKTGTHPEGDTP